MVFGMIVTTFWLLWDIGPWFVYFWKTAVNLVCLTKHSWLVGIWNIQSIAYDCFLGVSAHLHSRVHGCTQNSAPHSLRMSRPSVPSAH